MSVQQNHIAMSFEQDISMKIDIDILLYTNNFFL